MKDLYKLAGLKRFENDPEILSAAARACADQKDRTLIKVFLCDKEQKVAYDHALQTADLVDDIQRQAPNEADSSGSGHGARLEQVDDDIDRAEPGVNEGARRLLIIYALIFCLLFAVAFLITLQRDESNVETTVSAEQPEASGDGIEITGINITRESYYVTAEMLNVRQGPGTDSRVVVQLKQYDEVLVEFPLTNDDWARVIAEDGTVGYVSLSFIVPGNGASAFRTHCMQSAARPVTGHTFHAPISGHQSLSIEAPLNHDISARLVDSEGRTTLLGYIRAGEAYSFERIPVGRYQLRIGAGKTFSVDCELFMETMTEKEYPNPLNFDPSFVRSQDVEYQISIQMKEAGEADF